MLRAAKHLTANTDSTREILRCAQDDKMGACVAACIRIDGHCRHPEWSELASAIEGSLAAIKLRPRSLHSARKLASTTIVTLRETTSVGMTRACTGRHLRH